jgi:hypothetical protein
LARGRNHVRRSGKSSYHLTQIKTDLPPANLFKLPNDIKIRE